MFGSEGEPLAVSANILFFSCWSVCLQFVVVFLVFFVKMFWMLWEQVGGIITPPLLISSGFTPEGQNCQFFSLTSHKPIIFCCFLWSPEMAATKICFAHLCCNKQVGVARTSI